MWRGGDDFPQYGNGLLKIIPTTACHRVVSWLAQAGLIYKL